MNTLELPFDVYQRYKIIEQAVNIVRDNAQRSLRILDVGGHPGPLLRFLPQDSILVVDQIDDPELPNYQKADGLSLPFEDESFDMVTSVDVLEHIVPQSRERFLRELWRVSKEFVLLAAPFNGPQVSQSEEILFEFVKAKLEYEHNFLQEHLENGLPGKTQTLQFLQGLGAHTFAIPNGNVARWLPMMIISYYLNADARLKKVNTLVNSFYNEHYYPLDNSEPCYRYLLVAGKRPLSKKAIDQFQRLISPSAVDHDQANRVDLSRVLALIELFNMECMMQRDKVLKEKESTISDLSQHAGNLEQVLQGKEAHIRSLLEHANNLEGVIRGRDAQLANMNAMVADKDRRLVDLEEVLQAKDRHAQVLQEIIHGRELQITTLNSLVQTKDHKIVQLEVLAGDKTKELRSIEEALVQSNSDLKILPASVDNIAEAIQHIAEAIRQRDERVRYLESLSHNVEQEIQQREDRIRQLEELRHSLEELRQTREQEIRQREDRIRQLEELHHSLEELRQTREEEIRQRDEKIQRLEETIRTLEAQTHKYREYASQLEAQIRTFDEQNRVLHQTLDSKNVELATKAQEIMWLKDFEGKVKNLRVYKVYRALRLHKLFK